MNEKETKEYNLITVQIITSAISILTICTSIFLLYEQQKRMAKEEAYLDIKQAQILSSVNRIVIVIIVITFLIVNYKLYYISKKEGEDLQPYILQLIASYLSIAAAILALIVVINPSNEGELVDVENPTI